MSNITKLEFVALDISGKNYLSWILDAELHLDAMNLGATIKQGNQASLQDRAKALIFLRHHLHEGLKNEYLTVNDPFTLWSNLKERYDHQKTVILPKARYDWMHLRLQDFKTVSEYNSALFKISSQLKLCGEKITEEDMLEKTFTTFHASNVLLQQQYRERRFTKYSELISCLLVAKQNNEFLMRNHQSRPTGSEPFPEVNAISSQTRGRGRGQGRGRVRGHGRNPRYHGSYSNNSQKMKASLHHQKWNNTETIQENGKRLQDKPPKNHENNCYRCGINIEHPVTHTHTQNGLAESFIKRLQLIARPLLMKTKLPTSAWGHAIMHAAALVRIRPTTYHEYSPSQLVLGKQPNIFHLRIFGCAVYVPIAPTQRTKMGSQRRLGVYVGFDSPSIIRYLEPLTDDVFTARFADCHFNESVFPSLGREKSIPEERREISWKTSTMTHLDPCTNQCELEVQRIIHLQNLANQLPDAFIDTKKVTKSHIPAANTPARIDVPVGQLTNESKIRLKRGRLVGSKDVTPQKKRTQEKLGTLEEAQIMQKAPEKVHIEQKAPEEAHIEQETPEDPHIERKAPEEAQVPENCEISVSYVQTGEKWDRNNIVINNIFAFQVAFDIIRNDEDPEPRNVEECRHRNDWPKWKEAIQAELNSLTKREVFGPVVQTPEDV
ncbi:hypothetical protein VitviT2T_005726 [Vitis vinifera]|uniref:Integrase catalytic domain-containing protein n=1 Tax=Vitis vinifera TaxID=29760 RepID=A0ABY9BTR4_VITVI|nr:hypothetical protein VitviT2T_005726 [Vitis vinifera]